ncbi:MAG: 50S ribosomal protein L4 [Chloroflexi bacterium]|nr:50S ribosomal protein L4 [Chloroflexota bacterium]
MAGKIVGETELNEAVFGVPFNEGLVHQAVIRYLANQRVGTANTRRRSEVSGGGRKPWRQKGTGRARQGSIRAPQWRGGGVVFGPHPRDYRQDMPLKMRRQALRCALSQRAREGAIRVLDALTIERPKTKTMVQILNAHGLDRGALVVTPEVDQNVYLSARNIPGVQATFASELNIYDVVRHPVILIPLEAVRRLEQRLAAAS